MASSTQVPITSSSTYTSTPLQNQITTALISNGAIPTIQGALLHELQASGWTTNLRNYITTLMRSGECTRYDELMDRVLDEALKDAPTSKTRSNGTSAAAAAAAAADAASKSKEDGLRIPEAAVKEGIKVVRKELEKVCEFSDGK